MAKAPVKKQRKVQIRDLRDLSFKDLSDEELRRLMGGKIYTCPGDCDRLDVYASDKTLLSVIVKQVRVVKASPSR